MDHRDVTWIGVSIALCMLSFGAACGSDEIDHNDWQIGEQVKVRFTSETMDRQVGALETTVDAGGRLNAQTAFEVDDGNSPSFRGLSISWDADDDAGTGCSPWE